MPELAETSLVSEAQPATVKSITEAERQACARVANSIRALAKLYFSIHPASILRVYQVADSSALVGCLGWKSPSC